MRGRPVFSKSLLRKHGYELGVAAALTAIGIAALVLAGSETKKPTAYTKAGTSVPTPR